MRKHRVKSKYRMKCRHCGHEIERRLSPTKKMVWYHRTAEKHAGVILSIPCHFCDCDNPEPELKKESVVK